MKYKFRSVNGIFILCHNTCFHHTGINWFDLVATAVSIKMSFR
jgi:hypothetical protein